LCFILLILLELTSPSIIVIEDAQTQSNFVPITFDEYAVRFNKSYLTQEETSLRRQIFEANLIELSKLAKTCPTCGITKFTDWTQD
jgi:hypothetical protein